AAGAAARHPGGRAVRLPALVQRGGGGDLHRRPRRRDAAEEDVRIDKARVRPGDRGGVDAPHRRHFRGRAGVAHVPATAEAGGLSGVTHSMDSDAPGRIAAPSYRLYRPTMSTARRFRSNSIYDDLHSPRRTFALVAAILLLNASTVRTAN